MKGKILIASDHAGYELKQSLINTLASRYNCIDLGTNSPNISVDYNDYVYKLVQQFLSDKSNGQDNVHAILICGTGIGMSIAANRYPLIRAALCCDVITAKLSREHNDANVLVLGSRVTPTQTALNITKVFLETAFSHEERHIRRVSKLQKI